MIVTHCLFYISYSALNKMINLSVCIITVEFLTHFCGKIFPGLINVQFFYFIFYHDSKLHYLGNFGAKKYRSSTYEIRVGKQTNFNVKATVYFTILCFIFLICVLCMDVYYVYFQFLPNFLFLH